MMSAWHWTLNLLEWWDADHDVLGQHAIFAEHTAVSSASHPCPYIAYFGPIHPSSSNSGGTVSEASNFNHWNGSSVPSDIPTSYSFPAVDLHYHSWEHHSPPFSTASTRLVAADQPSGSPGSQRPVRGGSDVPRSGSFMHPFLVGHRCHYNLELPHNSKLHLFSWM